MTRVTFTSGRQLMLSDMMAAQSALTDSQKRLSSGKKMSVASDAPADAVATLAHRAELNRNLQLDRNADRAKDWLAGADRATSAVVDRLTEARSLVVQANSGAMDASARSAIATQLRDIRQSLLEAANTSILGRPIFGGTTGSKVAYDDTGTYVGDNGGVQIPVSPGVTMAVSRTGPQVFGTANATDPMNGDMFQMLGKIADDIDAGNTTNLGAGLSAIDTSMTRVQTVQTELGSRMDQLDTLGTMGQAREGELKQNISELEDVDVAEATVELKSQELAYQSALGAAGQVLPMTLLDFLK
jgi:flagellar hook-associated protein 3 FlgL